MIEYAPLTQKQADYIRRCQTSWLNVAEGGKRAGKNIINLIAWYITLETHPDKFHLAAGVSLGAAKMNIADSNGFGLTSLFAGRCRMGKYLNKDCLYIQTRTGEKIVIFAGGYKANDAAFIKGNSYGSIYITEVNECHQSFFQEAMDRTLASSERRLFFDLNPKPPGHWFYTEFLDYQDKLAAAGSNPGYNYAHFTIADNLSIASSQLDTELAKYDKQSVWYMADILGLRITAQGIIYTAYNRSRVTIKPEEIKQLDIQELSIGVDVGGTDATVATLVGFTSGWKDVVLIDGIYNKQGYTEKIDESTYVTMIVNWMEAWVSAYPNTLIGIYVDSANKLFRIGLRNAIYRMGWSRVTVYSFDKSDGINARISLNEMLFAQGRFRIAEHMKVWHEAYQMATWDQGQYSKGAWIRTDDGSYPVDALDSTEYAFYPAKRFLIGS